MSKFKFPFLKIFILFILFITFIFVSAKSYSEKMFHNISDNFLRLHVVANSDSTKDQMLKYQIRDEIIEYFNTHLSQVNTKDEAISILNENLPEIRKIASRVQSENGFNYPINVSINKSYFPTKDYSNIILPEGYYDALKIEIGNADGQNWWCVMFPSLCLINTNDYSFSDTSDEILQNNLSEEEYSIVSTDKTSANIKIKFKLIELFENI